MTTGTGTIYLMETDLTVAGDVVASVQLLDIPVEVFSSGHDVLGAAKRRKPLLVLARAKVGTDSKAAVWLTEEIERLPEQARVPVILLGTESEKHSVGDALSRFAGQLKVPVEFPIFTQHVQQLLEELVWASGGPAGISGEEVHQQEPVAAPAAIASYQSLPGTRLMMLYQVQMEVLRRLTASGALAVASIDGFERLLADETSRVCAELSELRDSDIKEH